MITFPILLETIEYALYLGMNLEKDKGLLYIAREGLKARLPEPWVPMRNSKSEIFYLNTITKERTILHPCDAYYKNLYDREKAKQQQQSNHKQQHLKVHTAIS